MSAEPADSAAEVDIHTTAGKLADLGRRLDEAVHAGSARAVEKQHARGKLTARERVDMLLDQGSFVEIDELTARALRVEGSLDDLLPQWPGDEAPSAPDQEAVLDAAAAALAALLTDRAGRHGRGPLVERFRRNSVLRRLPQPVQEWLKRRANR